MQRILSGAVVLVIALAAADARAQWGFPGYAGYGGYGFGYGYNGYSIYDQDRIPYFALHPPVYYSYPPVPRTFGYSPFAYPGWIMTPEYEHADPQTIVNPYYDQGVPPAASPDAAPPKPGAPAPSNKPLRASPSADRSAEAKPLRIVNPHYGPLVSRRAVK